MVPIYEAFYKIRTHLVDSIRYGRGLNYILAGLLTWIIVASGFDAAWYHFAAIEHPEIFRAGFVSVILGFFIPLFAPIIAYAYGRIRRKKSAQVAGLAAGQAAILGLAVSSFIKIFTGRLPPEALTPHSGFGGFQFGFFRGGMFNGWPSSHTTVAFALALALIELYPESKVLRISALAFACVIGLGVSVNIHWFSDVVAGALIGYAIGTAVGRSFRCYETSYT